jgi:hypothetical protein
MAGPPSLTSVLKVKAEARKRKKGPFCISQQDGPTLTKYVSVIPILLGLPTMVFSIPPLMVLIVAMLAFGIQIAPPRIGLGAVFAMIMDCFIQVCFRLFDGVLALRPVLGSCLWCRCYEHKQCSCYYCRDCAFSNSLNQEFSPLYFGGPCGRRLAHSIH